MQHKNWNTHSRIGIVICVIGVLVVIVGVFMAVMPSSSPTRTYQVARPQNNNKTESNKYGTNTNVSSGSSSGNYEYGTKESYDAKYGEGSYDADKELLDSARDAYNEATGRDSYSTKKESPSSSGYKYGTKESYDSKYGAGSYDADKKLLDEMRDAWNSGGW